MEKAVFLDRDGTINIDVGYINSPDDFELVPRSLEALILLRHAGYKLFIVTNQSGIARKLISHSQLSAVHDKMVSLLSPHGISFREIFYCPHHPDEECQCRKPNPLFVRQAALKYDLDLSRSWFVGDKTADVQCGKNAGTRAILVKTGYGGNDKKHPAKPDFIAADLYEAARHIIKTQA